MPEFAPVINVSTLNGANGFRLDHDGLEDGAGRTVAGGGDVNGDGISDLLIGALLGNASGFDDGLAWLVFGASASPAAQSLSQRVAAGTAYRFQGEAAGDQAGFSLADAGDVNGDGFDDLLVSARLADPDAAGGDRGATYLVFGGGANLEAFDAADGVNDNRIALGQISPTTGYRFDGAANFDNSGWRVSGGGDIDRDGVADLIIAAPFASSLGGSRNGVSYLIRGGLVNLAGLDSIDAGGADGRIDLSNVGSGSGTRLDGERTNAGDESGFSLAMVGDVNGDGFDDVLVGARFADPNSGAGNGNEGASYLVFGQPSPPASMALSGADGVNQVRFDGVAAGDYAGIAVNGAGDVNGDGLADLVIGASNADPHGDVSGSAYVVFGRTAFSASVDLASLDGSNGFRLDGLRFQDSTGWFVACAGDVNGDGFDDLAISAPNFDRLGAGQAGALYVVFGKASGFNSVINLGSLDGNGGFRIEGAATDDRLGYGVQGPAGDVNGDGFDDIVVGAHGADSGQLNSGSTYVIYGHRAESSVTRIGTELDNRINGGKGADAVSGLDGDDTLIGWEGGDSMAGGLGDDVITGDQGDDQIQGGDGDDSLTGGADDDALLGSSGEDSMDGGTGEDRCEGGSGADMFLASAGDDTAAGGSGSDLIDFKLYPTAGVTIDLITGSWSFGSDSLAFSSIERLAGTASADGFTGNARANTLLGRAGSDVLNGADGNDNLEGGTGNDTLTGGSGADSFTFNQAPNATTNRDRITDFVVADDFIRLDNSVFAGLSDGALAAGAFNTGSAAIEADDRIIFNPGNGSLIFDADGTGAAAPTRFAVLASVTGTLANTDFFVI